MPLLKLQEYVETRNALRMKRSTFFDHWKDLAEQVLPRHARFFREDRSRAGTKRNDKIINGYPTKAARILASGMAAGITSPTRIWYRMGVDNQDLMQVSAVQTYLHQVETRMRVAMAISNFYNGMGNLYLDLGVFGTAAMLIDEDEHSIIRCYPLMMGSYYLESSDRLLIDTCYREVSMTVKQMGRKFGLKNCSRHVQDLAKQGKWHQWQDVLHIIEPNDMYEEGIMGPDGFAFRSVWLEEKSHDEGKFLQVSGYHEFPVIAPRWEVTAEDNYGSSPAMDALGDCRMLQKMEKQKLKNYDKATDPALVGPTSLRNQRTSLLPGDITYSDSVQGNQLKPIQDPSVNANAVEIGDTSISRIENRIGQFFMTDMWLSMQKKEGDGVQPETARYVDEVHEEKMLQLGPTLSRFDDEGLNPSVKRIYGIMFRGGLFPPLPPELHGQNLKIQYINIMAQAQKLLETGGVERLAGFVSSMGAIAPEAKDLIDIDMMIREYAEMLGTNPDMLLSTDQVKQIRAQKAQAAQMQQTAAGAAQGAETAKNLSQVPMNEDNGLTRLMQMYSQAGSPNIPQPGGMQ
jgi:hypothetical protein